MFPSAAISRRNLLQFAAASYLTSSLPSSSGLAQEEPKPEPTDLIQRCRYVATELMQPTAAQMQQGLELHEDALVFDAYGFAPRAAIDGTAFQAAVDAGATEEELTDLREEMMMTRFATDASERAEFLRAMHAAGVTGIFQNCGEEGNAPLRLIKRLSRFQHAIDEMQQDLVKALHPQQVEELKKQKKLCLAFTTNGVPLRQQWSNERDELRLVKYFRQLGVRMMHLTYNRRNPLGDGCGEPNDGGVSEFGRTAIAELNRLGIIVDVAHSGWRTSREAAQVSKRPVVASHTTCAGLYSHFRGKPDQTVRAICESGGYIGICCIPRFLGGKGNIVDFFNHIDYALKTFGPDHVAIGTDVAYVSQNDALERSKIKPRSSDRRIDRTSWEHLWPKDDFATSQEATQSLAWTNWPLFTVGMLQRGHSEMTIRKVLGLNVLRVWRDHDQPLG